LFGFVSLTGFTVWSVLSTAETHLIYVCIQLYLFLTSN